MNDKITFKPIKGLEENLMDIPVTEGAVLFATDTGKMWMDTRTTRVPLGGSGASLLYGDSTPQEISDVDGNYSYLISPEDLDEPGVKVQINDLILNSDGSFYRIVEIMDDGDYRCLRMAVSGSGNGGNTPGGPSSGTKAITIKGKALDTVTLINGQNMEVKFTATSALDENADPYDEELIVNWTLFVTSTGTIYDSGTFKVTSGVEKVFEFGSKLRESTGSTLSIYATGPNSGTRTRTISYPVTTVELLLYESEKFNNLSPYNSTFTMYCNISGNIEKIIEYSIDGEVVGSKTLAKNISGEQSLTVTGVSHGYHTISINLYQSIDGVKGESVKEPLTFEIAVNDGTTKDPIIWIGDYANVYYNYDAIKIPFRVFDPTRSTVKVNFVKGITVIGSREEQSGAEEFSYWQIVDATDIGVLNTYTIQVIQSITDENGNVLSIKPFSREVQFIVEQDPNRNLSLVAPEALLLSFDSAGRSNNDSESIRTSWSYETDVTGTKQTYKGIFENFNWNNNGWCLDENNNSCLRISNGAKFTIPIGNMILNHSGNTANQSCTFEFEFKIKNVQNYSNLIKEYTRYAADTKYWNAFLAQMNDENGYDNYDNYLKWYSTQPEATQDYDEMTASFADITRMVSGDTPFCKYYDDNGHGLCLGPQDGFFSSAENTLNVKYVENQLINLTMVFSYSDKRLYIYLQGVLTAVCKITDENALEINADNIVFNSEYCDVDLYKFRVYNNALSVRDVLINYSVDHTSITDYDHTTQLISYNRNTGEYQLNYSDVIAWNRGDEEEGDSINRPDYLMPYVIWNTGSKSDKLPYSKSDGKKVGMTFVNTALDYAYKTGEIEDLANAMTDVQKAAAEEEGLTLTQYYYKHHCPSWTSDGLTVGLAVQGTSSEFYPRRNYKAKTKDDDDNIHMFLNRGPFKEDYNTFLTKYRLQVPKLLDNRANQAQVDEAQALFNKVHLDWFYFNNESFGCNKFTMKIDFMESSGTYNMGLANLVHSAYSKHPIDDYNGKRAFQKIKYIKDTAAAATSGRTYYSDAKGKTEVTFKDGVVYAPNTYYYADYDPYTFSNTNDMRTNAQGFPVMAFWRYGEKDTDLQFIGRYNYLSDKGSDETYGFKPDKGLTAKFLKDKNIRDIAECWEYSDNARGFCSFRDPKGRHKLNFNVYDSELVHEVPDGTYEKALEENPIEGVKYYSYDSEADTYVEVAFDDEHPYVTDTYFKDHLISRLAIKKTLKYNSKNSCPVVADSFEYRYHKKKDFLDYIYDPTNVSTDDYNNLLDSGYTGTQLRDMDYRSTQLFDIYKNWEKACQWVWSTCVDNVPTEADRVAGKAVARKIMTYTKADPATTSFDSGITYYDENEDLVTNPNETMFSLGAYYIGTPKAVTYDDTTYEWDTREYRLAKFTNELNDHFDLEYCLVYFVLTEVLLLYDSRGKNCMMASWGPQENGKDYIWYPIFYDMDTQLGINNAGIPSFEYSENATIDGTFSTSDNVLWNNLYTCFYDNIQAKYKDLRHTIKNSRYNGPGPLYNVDHIEKWYLADPTETNEIEMRGARPLAMFNMDEQFKYISICNPAIQYQDRQGTMSTDANGEFFYALQGNRSLSRQQFLARRLNFIDSWMSLGNYARSDSTAIEGRIGANKPAIYSDKWINKFNASAGDAFEVAQYYIYESDGVTPVKDPRGYPKKTKYLDADFFVELTPYQKSYVSIGLDNEAFPSKEYKDKEVRYEFPESNKTGIMNSPLLQESLIYIYGADALSDMGDVSTLYWSIFKANHAPHLQRILLGNDHPGFYNYGLGSPGFDAGLDSDWGKPLLKEVNLSGLRLATDGLTDFDFTSSEKMQIFKAVRSNITSVKFANGVALHTLYLPGTIKSLSLVKAANLDTVINNLSMEFDEATYTNPEKNKYYSTYYPATNSWVAQKGLYIAGLTDFDESKLDNGNSEHALGTIEIEGGALGYGSYDLLHKLYMIYRYGAGNGARDLKISMRNVQWSPYKKLDKAAIKKDDGKYFVDDGHYGFTSYEYTNENQWKIDLKNGRIYELDEKSLEQNKNVITDIQMLKDFITRGQFKNTTSVGTSVPVITGTIFVNNSEPIDENEIRNTLLVESAFGTKDYEEGPLDIHFANVIPGYSAKFIQLEPDGTYEVLGTQVLPSNSLLSSRFANPYDLYTASRDNYDFHGWSLTNDDDGLIDKNNWIYNDSTKIVKDKYDYTFYAIFTRHNFEFSYYSGTDQLGFNMTSQTYIPYGDYLEVPKYVPSLDESELPDDRRYRFVGWTQEKKNIIQTNKNNLKGLINIESIPATRNMSFYASYLEESVYDSVTDLKYFNFLETTYTDPYDRSKDIHGYAIEIDGYINDEGVTVPYYQLSGKITLPTTYNNLPIIRIMDNGFRDQQNITYVFFDDLSKCQLRSIETNGFAYSNKLVKVQLPPTLRYIGQYAFCGCNSLEMYNLDQENLCYIDSYAFHMCYAYKATPVNLYLGGNIRKIGERAFNAMDVTIKELIIGDNEHPSQLLNLSDLGSDSDKWVVYFQEGRKKLESMTIYCQDGEPYKFFTNLKNNNIYFDVENSSNISITLVSQ